jgi:ribose-phosphate pyrophosphokinase
MDCIQKEMKIFSGSSNPKLAQSIVDKLGASLSPLQLETFANGEIYARYPESVRGSDVFIIQSIAGPRVNDLLMEVLVMADAAKRASARTVTGVITHYAYARQDRKAAPREPITAKLVADLFKTAGIDRLITIDLHQGQIQGFFDGPVNHLTALPLFAKYYSEKGFDMDNTVVVSPDVGRAKASKRLADMLGCNFAVAHKGRPAHNAAEVMGIIGDIEGKTCIINDDMIDTAGTLCGAVKELKNKGAGDVYVGATHGLLSGPAYQRLQDAPVEEVLVTDAVPLDPERSKACTKIKVISVADEFARAIQSVYSETSVSGMFGINPEF